MIEFTEVKTHDDISLIVKLAQETWNVHYLPIIGQQQIDYMLANYQNKDIIQQQLATNFNYYITKKDNLAIGYFAIAYPIEMNSLHISKLYLKKIYQRNGIGRAMISFIETLSINKDIYQLWLTVNRQNKPAIQFYNKAGFINAGCVVEDIGNGFVMDDYKMIKILSINE